jgi:hypothetical protein
MTREQMQMELERLLAQKSFTLGTERNVLDLMKRLSRTEPLVCTPDRLEVEEAEKDGEPDAAWDGVLYAKVS